MRVIEIETYLHLGDLQELLDMGAVRLVIPGNFPIGCIPAYLTLVNSVNPSAYDENDCLIDLNAFAMSHNVKLQKAIEVLRLLYPNAVIAYADYFRAFLYILNNADKLGIVYIQYYVSVNSVSDK